MAALGIPVKETRRQWFSSTFSLFVAYTLSSPLTLESTRQRIQGDNHDNTRWDTRRRGSHTRLGLERRSGERPCRRVRIEQCSQRIVDPDRNQLLVRVDLVPVQTTKRLGDGDVFEQEDDDGDGKFGSEGGE
jgi:hypothetical protein